MYLDGKYLKDGKNVYLLFLDLRVNLISFFELIIFVYCIYVVVVIFYNRWGSN